MKNKKVIKVIRSENQTVVIYRDPPKEKAAVAPMRQRAIPVYILGHKVEYIMPDGRRIPVRGGKFWRIVKFIRPQAQFAI